MSETMLRKGDMVKPFVGRHRFGRGTLALLLETKDECYAEGFVKVLWLNGDYRGQESLEYDDLFVKVGK